MHEDDKKCIQHLDGKSEGNRQLERPRHRLGVGAMLQPDVKENGCYGVEWN
jgi:hypothetical protein